MRIPARRSCAAAAAALVLLAACGGDGPTGDRTAPTVLSTEPDAGATLVARSANVTATFSERLDPSTVNPTTFTLTPAGGAAVQAIVTLNPDDNIAILDPTETLAFGTTYTARLTTDIEDVAGNALAQAHTWTFTTEANPAPTVVSVVPANNATGVAGLATITVTFSEPVANVSSTTFTVTPAGGSPIEGTIGVNGAVVTFQPTGAMPFGTTLTARLTTGITDLFGQPLAQDYVWAFSTMSNDPPAANAGPAQDVNRGATVTLAGTATDPNGHAITLYRWTQVYGPDVTGGVGFIDGQNATFTAPNVVSTVRFELRVTDQLGAQSQPSLVQINVMEDAARAIFVSPLGDDNNPGTSRSAPVKTIIIGVARAATDPGGPRDVYVVNGTYNEGVNLSSGVSIYGGFHSGTWLRDPVAAPTTILGPTNMVGLYGSNVANITIDGLNIRTPLEFIATGQTAYGVYLSGVQNVTITNNTIFAGDAGPGSGGQFGFTGAHGLRGGDGGNAACPSPGAGGAGGQPQTPNAGAQLGPAGGAGGDGGAPGAGGQTGFTGSGPTAGAAGQGGAFAGGNGGAGGAGQPGTAGVDGTGASGAIVLGVNGFVPRDGTGGSPGTSGSSGGGGGGGAGTTTGAGGGGGGGGAGGGGGNAGQGGRGGGGSFAILVMQSTNVTIIGNRLIASDGGSGGSGGAAGNGGTGGLAGVGGSGCDGGGSGGPGGAGGHGGMGGHGGGGAGGPSIGILADATSTISVASNVISVGTPGAGGFSQGPQGAQGAAGITADVFIVP